MEINLSVKGWEYRKKMKGRSKENDDSKIAVGICNNEKWAYNEFINKYYNLILHLCKKSRQNNNDAEELCDDILLKIFKNIHSYDHKKGNLIAWTYIITRNYLRDNLRKEDSAKYEVSIEKFPGMGNNDDDYDSEEYFNEEFWYREYADPESMRANELYKKYLEDRDKESPCGMGNTEITCLQNALKQINERDQLIVQYRAEGFDYDEITEFLNIKYKTATTAYSRAVMKIKAEYYKELAMLKKQENSIKLVTQNSDI